MRLYLFNILLLAAITTAYGAETQLVNMPKHVEMTGSITKDTVSKYEKKVERYQRNWDALIPTQFIIQNAGNMGILSMGIGWDYGKRDQWETHVLFGLIPKHASTRAKATMTVKETFIPWLIALKKDWSVEPLATGVYLNTVFGHEFWGHQPSRYPDSYYDFLSTKVRVNVFAGQRLTWIVPVKKRKSAKSITAFYELSTSDLYLRAMVVDHYVKLTDIVGLSLGLKFYLCKIS